MIRLAPSYAELSACSNFSFLRGASHPEEMAARAVELGLSGLGLADRNCVAGVVRAHVFLRENADKARGFRFAPGARLVFSDATPDVLAYPETRKGWGRLTRLLTTGNLRARKGECELRLDDLLAHGEDIRVIVAEGASATRASKAALREATREIAQAFRGRVWIGAAPSFGEDMRADLAARAKLARELRAPLIALNEPRLHAPQRRALADVLACIREGATLAQAGAEFLSAHAERHLKGAGEMARLFADLPEATDETLRFLRGLSFSLDALKHHYPEEVRQGFDTPQQALAHFAAEGARERYPEGVPEKVTLALAHELALVETKGYAPYFLTVHDLVRHARSKGILCQGRGSAANSALCFCLGITEVDPAKSQLLFERFISPDRDEPPDIDVDFEHERREEVIQYLYERYGRDHAGLAATVISYRGRSSMREVGKVFGLSQDMLDALSGTIWGWSNKGPQEAHLREMGLDPSEPNLRAALEIAGQLRGFPRHLSQHVGGFVITHDRLDEVVPVSNAAMEGRTCIEWDKDDLDALGLLKIDVLALGMLSALRRGFDLIAARHGRTFTLATLPSEERCVYAMIEKADTLGVFQIESRAQMTMLPRLRPKEFYDLVIEVAIGRPGPIQGDMVHPYLRRRQGIEEVEYPSQELEDVLKRTLGVPLFQEQAMQIAIVAAGFTPAEADKLRRAMATFRRVGTIHSFHEKMVKGMVAKGYEEAFASRCFQQIEGFGEYGFPESHAASFALLVYASCWMKRRYPDAFCAAMLNAQPLGFYAPAQLVRDAREHGIEVREADVNFSGWDATLEDCDAPPALHPRFAGMESEFHGRSAVRLGLRQIEGLKEAEAQKLVAARGRGYDSVRDLWLRAGLHPSAIETLAQADAFSSLGLPRRDALWAARGLNRSGDKDDLPLFLAARDEIEADADLPPMPPGEEVVEDYRALSLSLKAHPVAFLRAKLMRRGAMRCEGLADIPMPARPDGTRRVLSQRITVAGLTLVRQRPGTASGVIFMTIEDESGIANIVVWPKIFERMRAAVIGARLVAVTGRVQREGEVIHVVAERVEDWSAMLADLSEAGRDLAPFIPADEGKGDHGGDARRDGLSPDRQLRLDGLLAPRPAAGVRREETRGPPAPARAEAERARRAMPKGRNFH